MFEFESKLARSEWVLESSRWTTVQKGIGFCLYSQGGQMWLAGYPKEVVAERQSLHHTTGPHFTTYNKPLMESMFNIPASVDFVSMVILCHYPELT